MLLITGKCKTPFVYHQTLLSRAHFHILAMTFSCNKEYSFASRPLLQQSASTAQDAALHARAGFNCLQRFPAAPAPHTSASSNGHPASAPRLQAQGYHRKENKSRGNGLTRGVTTGLARSDNDNVLTRKPSCSPAWILSSLAALAARGCQAAGRAQAGRRQG